MINPFTEMKKFYGDDSSKWTQYTAFRIGKELHIETMEFVERVFRGEKGRACLMGCADLVSRINYTELTEQSIHTWQAIREMLDAYYPLISTRNLGIVNFNDDPRTEFSDILLLLDTAESRWEEVYG